jgi:hypothetical protein
VLAVISQKVIQIFAKTRARSRDDFGIGKGPRGMRKRDNAFAAGELFQRHFLNRTALQSIAKTGVVHDSSVPHVNAVMRIENPVSNDMSAGRK